LVKFRKNVVRKLREQIYIALLKKDWVFWSEFKPQEITQFVENELVYVEKGLNERMGMLWSSVMMTIGGLLYVLTVNWL